LLIKEIDLSLRPLGRNVVLREKQQEQTLASGIVLTGDTGTGSRGEVIATGPEATLVNIGDIVSVNWKNGKVAKTDQGSFIVVSQDDILAIIEE
jgi:co-chaperonin GroES (HSP10)